MTHNADNSPHLGFAALLVYYRAGVYEYRHVESAADAAALLQSISELLVSCTTQLLESDEAAQAQLDDAADEIFPELQSTDRSKDDHVVEWLPKHLHRLVVEHIDNIRADSGIEFEGPWSDVVQQCNEAWNYSENRIEVIIADAYSTFAPSLLRYESSRYIFDGYTAPPGPVAEWLGRLAILSCADEIDWQQHSTIRNQFHALVSDYNDQNCGS